MERFADKIDNYRGLTSDEAAERLIMYGYNCDSRTLETSGDFKPAGSMFSLRFILMALAAVIILLCGRTGEGFVMLLLAFIYSATEIFKGMKCRDTFKELRRISGARFRVLRDGNISLLRREYIVPDDIIILQEGENVPADAHILEAQGVFADEFLFTGDRTPSSKRTGVDSKNDVKQTCLYKGTRLLSGNAVARVVATGIDTKKCRDFGEEYENEAKTYVTGIEAAINGLMPVFYLASGAFLVLFFIITFSNWKSDPSLSLGEAFRSLSAASLLPAFAFALCLIPAECPRLVRAHYLYGAFSLLKRNCIVKDLNAMASLSAITAVCVDKTGIITKTHTSLVDEYTTDADALSRISVLSCDQSGSPDASALDRAIILGAAFKGTDVKALHENELIRRYPFSEEAKLGGSLWDINGSLLLCIKGSPETVLTKCSNLQPDYLFSVQQKQQKYAAQGHRVVAVAYARVDADSIPDDAYDAEYTFVG
ncbi:MAG: hypothetical protein FWE60_03555, partial [Oscillospiraceae bacterium]|nr:hypothetical protein [Oscillospiraceae bacterium]